MSEKRHLIFKNPQEGLVAFKQRPGGGGNDKEEEEKDYTYMVDEFERCITNFHTDQKYRHSHRTLDIPSHFDLISIEFQSYFNQPDFENDYYSQFGLAIVNLSNFNKRGLFVIHDEELFSAFFEEISLFIDETRQQKDESTYNKRVKYIKSFSFHSADDMKLNVYDYSLIQFHIVDNNLISDLTIQPQKDALVKYFKDSGLSFEISDTSIELLNINEDTLNNVLANFDILNAACSSSGSIVRPDNYNVPERSYGFEIAVPEGEMPTIGIIDTGVSKNTPLDSILVEAGPEYDITGTNLYLDEVDHGTSVACLAALGKSPIPEYQGSFEASCKILPIKVLNEFSGTISPFKIARLIRMANQEFAVRIFTLTIGYADYPLSDNQNYSAYARLLDNLTSDLDILIIISTTNNPSQNILSRGYPDVFTNTSSNIASPAESINNLVVGSISDCINNPINPNRISPFYSCPASYSRKFHIDFEDKRVFNQSYVNNLFRKPDILLPGGEYSEYDKYGVGLENESSGIELLSSVLRDRTIKNIGTSLSAGLAANAVVKILKLYPGLDMQTVKALMVNSSSLKPMEDLLNPLSKNSIRRTLGYGALDEERLYFSNPDSVTFLFEDEIEVNHTKCYSLKIPQYLNTTKRKIGLLKITATLCFKVKPNINNQLLYCPVHLSFIISKNLSLAEGINGNKKSDMCLNSSAKGWAQDYYYYPKVFSNVQKVEFNVMRKNIVAERNVFKIGIACAFHKLMPDHERIVSEKVYPYSMVMNIQQIANANETLPSLYDELIAINDLEPIVEQEIDLDIG